MIEITHNILDKSAASTLIRAGALDTLFARGRRVVITQNVIDEIVGDRPDSPNQAAFLKWLDDNENRIVKVGRISQIDLNKYEPGKILANSGDTEFGGHNTQLPRRHAGPVPASNGQHEPRPMCVQHGGPSNKSGGDGAS